MIEEWRKVEGYEGFYEISNLGNVCSLEREYIRNGNKFIVKGRILKASVNSNGYFVVSLCVNGIPRKCYVHRLIAEAFIPNKENKRTVNHIDGIKTNNNIENLEWATYSENNKHAFDTGLKTGLGANANGNHQGESHPRTKLKESDVRYIRINSRKNGGQFTNRQLANKFGVCMSNVSEIINLKKWKHVI